MQDRAALIEEIFNISCTYLDSVAPEEVAAELSKYPHIGQQHGEIGSPA